jgi:hypothetical protein
MTIFRIALLALVIGIGFSEEIVPIIPSYECVWAETGRFIGNDPDQYVKSAPRDFATMSQKEIQFVGDTEPTPVTQIDTSPVKDSCNGLRVARVHFAKSNIYYSVYAGPQSKDAVLQIRSCDSDKLVGVWSIRNRKIDSEPKQIKNSAPKSSSRRPSNKPSLNPRSLHEIRINPSGCRPAGPSTNEWSARLSRQSSTSECRRSGSETQSCHGRRIWRTTIQNGGCSSRSARRLRGNSHSLLPANAGGCSRSAGGQRQRVAASVKQPKNGQNRSK